MTTTEAISTETAMARKIPIWIIIYALLQMLTSVVGIYGGYIDPAFFYAQFPNADFADPLIRHLAGVWGSKNLAIVLVMLFGIIRRHPQGLGTIFLLKGIADTVDILYTNTAFMPGSTLMMALITWLILGLPQLVIAYILFKRSGAKF